MKNSVPVFLYFLALTTFGQTPGDNNQTVLGKPEEQAVKQRHNAGPSSLTFVSDESKARQLAESDIKNGTPFLLLMGGIAPVMVETDPEFEKKYGIFFYEYGCTGPDDKMLTAYNETVFDFLTDTFGKKWMREVRDDVIGLKAWKRKR
ncbi:FEKKY domain-containing protein [Sinomicrobium pectinilyticum]|uniref:FEKKY domain-containing protein n=1 Tax=Sinomicrobium pectinilyticum TaxID=1084421 RepID=UPI0011CD7A13|nr:hypothetical protein [Sinomicrobium pectinilyticum]